MNIEYRFLQKAIVDKNYVSFSYENRNYKKVKPLKLDDETRLTSDKGVFEFGPLDFPRIVKHKKRKNNKRRTRQEREILTNRKYEDFIEFTKKNPELNIVEMDTVEGLMSDSKCILTLFWRKSNFMLMFLLENQTTDEVTKVFDYLQKTLSEDDYKKYLESKYQ